MAADEKLQRIIKERDALLMRGSVYGWRDEIENLRRMAGPRMDEVLAMLSEAREENERLREAASLGAKWMEWWLGENDCDCYSGFHTCGRSEREAELVTIRAALEPGHD